jgi:hypothetical protein
MKLLLALGGALLGMSAGCCDVALGQQFVNDTAFCKAVTDKECVDAIPSGSTIDLGELNTDANGPVLYFWGGLRNPTRSVVGFLFARGGECYTDGVTVSDRKARSSVPALRSLIAWGRTRTLGDLTSIFFKDLKVEAGAKISGVDVKLSGAVAEASDNFRIHTFRNVLCEGTVEARLIDSQRAPIPPEFANDVKSLTITNRQKGAVASR